MIDLLIDIGNTRLKWVLRKQSKLLESYAVLHHNQSVSEILLNFWKNIEAPRHVAVSSVVSEKLRNEVLTLAKTQWPNSILITAQSQSQDYGVNNAYKEPSKLGVDRWLCLVAARHYHTLPVCIVDCGTAITVDVLDATGQHQGGLIAPGMILMKKSLSRGAEDLPYSDRRYSAGLAVHTEAAIDSGTLFAALGLIERVMQQQPENTGLLLTGGDAELIAGYLSENVKIEPELVFQGLSVLIDNR